MITPYYQDDKCTIYLGDCREILPTIGTFDLLLTDPPYGIGENGKRSNRNRKGDERWKAPANKDYGENTWDSEPVEDWAMELVRNITGKQIIFGGNYYNFPLCRGWLVWDKETDGKNGADCELAWTNFLNSTKRIRHLWDGFRMKQNEKRAHPTQKPLSVISWALAQAGEVETVLDPWMGSGTTLRACKDVGVHCVGIEREEKYCEIAVKRLAQECLALD
jgi:DNA modification methylase